jgi:hypothetical protein
MIECKKCSWRGKRDDLTIIDELNYLNINNWCLCPNCFAKIDNLTTTPTSLTLAYSSSVLSINTDYTLDALLNTTTFIHLSRILDFTISNNHLSILGYKKLSTYVFNLRITSNFEFESIILLKILHLAHLKKNKCESKISDDYVYFGNWGTNKQPKYPIRCCSFCARFYEWIQKQNNSWPLSFTKIQKINLDNIKQLSGVPVHTNNKFSKIFAETNEEKNSKHTICTCNEISPRPNPNCSIHNEESQPQVRNMGFPLFNVITNRADDTLMSV